MSRCRCYNEPHLTKDDEIEYVAWLKCRFNQQRTEVILRILPSDDIYGVCQWGKGGRFVLPIPSVGKDRADNGKRPRLLVMVFVDSNPAPESSP